MVEHSRRRFLGQLGIAGATGLGGLGIAGLGGGARSFAAEPPPEITTVTLEKDPPAICIAPEYVAEGLLRAEGFTDIRYRARDADATLELAHNQVDWTFVVAPSSNCEPGQRRSHNIGCRCAYRLLGAHRT